MYTFGNLTNTVLDTKTIYLYPWNYNTGPSSPTAVFTDAITKLNRRVIRPLSLRLSRPRPPIFRAIHLVSRFRCTISTRRYDLGDLLSGSSCQRITQQRHDDR